MKKYIFFIIFIITYLFLPQSVSAKVMFQEKSRVIIPQSELINDDLFVGTESFDFYGTITGSVFAGAGVADIKGIIQGDLILGAGNANISGIINGDLYVGGGDIMLSGAKVSGNVVVGSGNLIIDSTTIISGSLITGSGNLKNNSTVGRNILAAGGTIYLNGKVGKEAHLAGGTIELGENSIIAGNLMYALEDETTLIQNQSSTVSGTVSRYVPSIQTQQEIRSAKRNFNRFELFASRGLIFASFLGSLILGFVILKLFPKTFQRAADQVRVKPIANFGIGFLMTLAALPVFFVLALTVIGLPLAIMFMLVFWIGLILSKLIVSLALGKFVVTQFNWKKVGVYGVFSIGLLLFYIFRLSPAFDWIVSLTFTWIGLGALWQYGRVILKNL